MKPTDDRIFVKPLPHEDLTESGLIIPEAAKGKQTRVEVMYIGDKVDPEKHCRVADYVLIPENAGMEFSYNDVDMKVVRWLDVQAILDRNVKSAEEVIRDHRTFNLTVLETVNKGTVKEKFLVDLNGHKFYLQGNSFEPVREGHSFCEKPGHVCKMNYCDENGCVERKREMTEEPVTPIPANGQI